MSYLCLARKYRPQSFDEIIGQKHVSQTLKNAISENRIAHAYLFSGPRGCGKTTVARVLAKALNCKNGPTVNPCGVCENCLDISKSVNIDVLEIDGASNNGIDEIRTLRENVKFSSANSKYKIYIIDEAHQITIQAFNALLKTLEEPPSHVIFIMATTEQHKIPSTIVSRCQKYRFKLIPSVEIAAAIKNLGQKEGFEIDDEALNVITKDSGGSMRDALSLLDQLVSSSMGKITEEHVRELLGLLPKEIIASATESIAKCDICAILNIVKEITEQGYNVLQFTRDLRDHLRQIMIYSIDRSISEISPEDEKLFDSQKDLFTVSRHVRMNNLLSKALEEMRWYDQPRILLEMYLLKISEPYYNVGELIKMVSDLEKSVKFGGTLPSCVGERQPVQVEKNINIDSSTSSIDLIVVWDEIVDETIKTHPLTAQSLKKVLIKVSGDSSVQLTVARQFDYESVIEFKEKISELFKKKTGLNILIGITVDKNIIVSEEKHSNEIVADETVVKEEFHYQNSVTYAVKEDFKETAKSAVPKRIEEIAKKFGSVAKKLQ